MSEEQSKEVKELKKLLAMARRALRAVDRQMGHSVDYLHGWVNYPSKPETTPAKLVRKAIESTRGKRK